MSKNFSELSGRKGMRDNLFDKFRTASEKSGSISVGEIEDLSQEYLLGTAPLYGAMTFYDFLKPDNVVKKVYTCNGSACLLAGTQDKVRNNLQTYFTEDEIGEMCCLGRCHENASFHYNGHNYSGAQADQMKAIFTPENGVPSGKDTYHVDSSGSAILTSQKAGLEDIQHLTEKLLAGSPEDWMQEIKTSSLRGRGGAGFPIHFKMNSCKDASGDEKFVVCNADEGDPGAFTDRYILEERPHELLFGIYASAYLVGAGWGILYIRAEYPESVRIILKAVEEWEAVLQSTSEKFPFRFKIIEAKGAYICGEETALLASIEGQRPEVRVRPPYPTIQGLFNQPTLVNNVETQANLYHIIKNGGEWFSKIGTEKSTGTKLLSLDSRFERPGVYEVDMGTPLSELIHDLAGGFKAPSKAMHIGGPLGGLVPVSMIDDLTIDYESFKSNGFELGHASVIAIPEDYPIVEYMHHIFQFTSHESCGKCFPCRLGSKRGEELLERAMNHDEQIDVQLFEDLLETMEIGSLCGLGGAIPLPIRNALMYFKEELTPYFSKDK